MSSRVFSCCGAKQRWCRVNKEWAIFLPACVTVAHKCRKLTKADGGTGYHRVPEHLKYGSINTWAGTPQSVGIIGISVTHGVIHEPNFPLLHACCFLGCWSTFSAVNTLFLCLVFKFCAHLEILLNKPECGLLLIKKKACWIRKSLINIVIYLQVNMSSIASFFYNLYGFARLMFSCNIKFVLWFFFYMLCRRTY